VIPLVELISLGAGLSGGRSAEEGLESWLWSVSEHFVPSREKDPWTLSKDVCLTLALTLPRLLIGSNDIILGFDVGV
jgi:hypothetical protein